MHFNSYHKNNHKICPALISFKYHFSISTFDFPLFLFFIIEMWDVGCGMWDVGEKLQIRNKYEVNIMLTIRLKDKHFAFFN